jgi:hypothetical protein
MLMNLWQNNISNLEACAMYKLSFMHGHGHLNCARRRYLLNMDVANFGNWFKSLYEIY